MPGGAPGIMPLLCMAGPPPPNPGGASEPPCTGAVEVFGGTGSFVLML